MTLSAGNIAHQHTSLHFIGLDTKPDLLIQICYAQAPWPELTCSACLIYFWLFHQELKYLDYITHDNASFGGKNTITFSCQAYGTILHAMHT